MYPFVHHPHPLTGVCLLVSWRKSVVLIVLLLCPSFTNASNQSNQIVDDLVAMILKRAEMGKNYGVVMLPEGLIEFIPEFNALISDINDVLASGIPTTIGELHGTCINSLFRTIYNTGARWLALLVWTQSRPKNMMNTAPGH